MDKPMNEYAADAPRVLRDFLTYISTIRGKSAKTAHEYYLDLRLFFRVLKHNKGAVDKNLPLDEIDISDIDLDFIRDITLSDTYDYLEYMAQSRPTQQNSNHTNYGLSVNSRARKVSAIRAFFRYLTDKQHVLEVNPVSGLEAPTVRKSLPTYLTTDDSVRLLESVTGPYAERDYCILTFFLNCGMRVSELVGLNLTDFKDDTVRVLGKGGKQRTVFLNDACLAALEQYLPKRLEPNEQDADALFVSKKRNRINVQTVKWLVKKYIGQYLALMAGTDAIVLSAGVGENCQKMRRMIFSGWQPMGIILDQEKNKQRGFERIISHEKSRVPIIVIPTDEEYMIARDTYDIIKANSQIVPVGPVRSVL